MKKTIKDMVFNSNGQFTEFYTFEDLPKYLQKEYAEEMEDLESAKFVSTCGTYYPVDAFLFTKGVWVNLPEYAEEGLHGVLMNDYSVALEVSSDGTMYRTWLGETV